MRLLKRVIKTSTEDGVAKLPSKTVAYLSTHIHGGLSSRPRLRSVAGILRPFFNIVFRFKHGTGVDVIEEDWDTLILLDACRYDDFERQCELEGTLESRISSGADSPRFIKENFVGRELHDTVYVTANPHVRLVDNDVFHSIIDSPLSNWDSETNCVKPQEVTRAAIRAHEDYPDKRIIVHYMQPHDPPLGPIGDELRNQFNLGGVEATDQTGQNRLFEEVVDGNIEVKKAREAYRETLNIALNELKKLLSVTDGRVVVSSDHGEMFGEQPYPILGELYEHYRHPYTIELCKVPWLIVDEGTRRRIISEPPTETEERFNEEIEEKLEALGYK